MGEEVRKGLGMEISGRFAALGLSGVFPMVSGKTQDSS